MHQAAVASHFESAQFDIPISQQSSSPPASESTHISSNSSHNNTPIGSTSSAGKQQSRPFRSPESQHGSNTIRMSARSSSRAVPSASALSRQAPPARLPTTPLTLSKSLQQLLPCLSTQKPHYITAHIHRFPYLLTEGDTLRLPFHMHGVYPGDILRLNRASLLGSRDFTMKAGRDSPFAEFYDGRRINHPVGSDHSTTTTTTTITPTSSNSANTNSTDPSSTAAFPHAHKNRQKQKAGPPNYLDERLFECRARVMGVDSGPMIEKIKTKRRNRKEKHVRSKHRYTVLRVMQVKVKSLEELKMEGEGRELVLE